MNGDPWFSPDPIAVGEASIRRAMAQHPELTPIGERLLSERAEMRLVYETLFADLDSPPLIQMVLTQVMMGVTHRARIEDIREQRARAERMGREIAQDAIALMKRLALRAASCPDIGYLGRWFAAYEALLMLIHDLETHQPRPLDDITHSAIETRSNHRKSDADLIRGLLIAIQHRHGYAMPSSTMASLLNCAMNTDQFNAKRIAKIRERQLRPQKPLSTVAADNNDHR